MRECRRLLSGGGVGLHPLLGNAVTGDLAGSAGFPGARKTLSHRKPATA
jgi:hypothetical protein